MDIQEIDVEIDQDGQVVLHVKGMPGSACLKVTAELESALGNLVLNRQMTPEAGDDLKDFQVEVKPAPVLKQGRR